MPLKGICEVCGVEIGWWGNHEICRECKECAVCGAKNGDGVILYENKDSILCGKHEEERVQQLVKTFDENTDYLSEITCPHCGYEWSDSWEITNDTGELECGQCGLFFEYYRDVEVTYCTSKIERASA